MEHSEPIGTPHSRVGQIATIVASAALLAAFFWPVAGLLAGGSAVVIALSPRVPSSTRTLVFALAGAALVTVGVQLALALPAGATLGPGVITPG